jgi:hypothetical protein
MCFASPVEWHLSCSFSDQQLSSVGPCLSGCVFLLLFRAQCTDYEMVPSTPQLRSLPAVGTLHQAPLPANNPLGPPIAAVPANLTHPCTLSFAWFPSLVSSFAVRLLRPVRPVLRSTVSGCSWLEHAPATVFCVGDLSLGRLSAQCSKCCTSRSRTSSAASRSIFPALMAR